ncbi:hypothetical protein [Azospirillum palustre]
MSADTLHQYLQTDSAVEALDHAVGLGGVGLGLPVLDGRCTTGRLKRWALDVAKCRGMMRAKVVLARKLATFLHRTWVDGTDFRFGKEAAAA